LKDIIYEIPWIKPKGKDSNYNELAKKERKIFWISSYLEIFIILAISIVIGF
jgi:hypothetical protein